MSKKWKRILCSIALVLAAFFWGTTFVAQKSAVTDSLGTFTFNGIRCMIGTIALAPLALTIGKPPKIENRPPTPFKKQFLYGAICGLILFASTNLQQWGLTDTTAGKSGFVTALYVVLVPIFGLLFFRKKVGWNIWPAVMMAAVGLYLLCVETENGFTVQMGDVITFFCAIVFAFHILAIDSFTDKISGVTLSCIQFFVTGTLSLICMVLFETPTWESIQAAGGALLYAGILSCGVAYTLQIVGQKHTDPTVASLLMSLESVFAVLSGWMILDENMKKEQVIGCVIMFAAIVIAQIPFKKIIKRRNSHV